MSTLTSISLRPKRRLAINGSVLAGLMAAAFLACSIAGAAPGQPDVRSDELRTVAPHGAQRPARAQELRQQLREHGKRWRGGAVVRQFPSQPGVSNTSAGLAVQTLPALTPVIVPAATAPASLLPAPPAPAAMVGTPAASALRGDSRLSDRERNLLRQQLRQVPLGQTLQRD